PMRPAISGAVRGPFSNKSKMRCWAAAARIRGGAYPHIICKIRSGVTAWPPVALMSPPYLFLQCGLNRRHQLLRQRLYSRLESLDHIAAAVHKKLGEVPLNLSARLGLTVGEELIQ